MAAVIKGTACVWSTNGLSWTGTGLPSGLVQQVNYTKGADNSTIKDGNGNVVTDIFSNIVEEMEVEIAPTASTIANAVSNNLVPDPGTDITFTDTQFTQASQKYFVMSGSQRRANDGFAVLTLKCTRRNKTDVSTAS
jgi:hypothetical protein